MAGLARSLAAGVSQLLFHPERKRKKRKFMREELIGMLCIALGYPSLAVIAHHRLAETTTYDIAHRAVGNRTTLAFLYLS